MIVIALATLPGYSGATVSRRCRESCSSGKFRLFSMLSFVRQLVQSARFLVSKIAKNHLGGDRVVKSSRSEGVKGGSFEFLNQKAITKW